MESQQEETGEGVVQNADGTLERGKPSRPLAAQEGGILDTGSGDYDPLTEAVPEKGMFHIVGGYVDDEGNVHREVMLRSMGGKEEDLLGATGIPITQRFTEIMANCVQRIGDISGHDQVRKAVHDLPSGSRIHLLISLRRTTHWRRHKDIYEMVVRCPSRPCRKESTHKIDLGKLDLFDMPEPDKRTYDIYLQDAEVKVTWKVLTGAGDMIINAITGEDERETLTYAIMARLHAIDGQELKLGVSDYLNADHTKLKLSKRAQRLKEIVQGWTSADRDDLRVEFEEKEPGVDTEIEFDCPHCGVDFMGALSVGQPSFFFPSATSKRSNRKSSS